MVQELGNLLEARQRPVLKNFAKYEIEHFEKEVERFKKDCRNAGLPRSFLNLNSEKLSFLSIDQIDFIKEDRQLEEVTETDVIAYFDYIKEKSAQRYLDVVQLLESARMQYYSSEIQSFSRLIMYCRKRLQENNVHLDNISVKKKEGRINLFKVLAAKLSPKNKEEFLFWLKQTRNAEGKLQIKNPEWDVCKNEYLRLLREDFKALRGKVKLGHFINYNKRRNDSLKPKQEEKRSHKIAKVGGARTKKSKRGTTLVCWHCGKNHSMKECGDIPEADRKKKYLEELERRKKEWKAKRDQSGPNSN